MTLYLYVEMVTISSRGSTNLSKIKFKSQLWTSLQITSEVTAYEFSGQHFQCKSMEGKIAYKSLYRSDIPKYLLSICTYLSRISHMGTQSNVPNKNNPILFMLGTM